MLADEDNGDGHRPPVVADGDNLKSLEIKGYLK